MTFTSLQSSEVTVQVTVSYRTTVCYRMAVCSRGGKKEKKVDSRSLIYGRHSPFQIRYSIGVAFFHEAHFMLRKGAYDSHYFSCFHLSFMYTKLKMS